MMKPAFDEQDMDALIAPKISFLKVRFEQDCSKDYCLINEVNPNGIGIAQKKLKNQM